MSLFDKFQPIVEIRAELEKLGVMPFGAVTEKLLSSTEAIVNGHKVILAGTNNYLGLTFDPQCIAAAKQAVEEQGTGTTGSRMANGTFAEHIKLEQELAAFFDRRHAIVFSTGYAATMGMASTLAGPGDVIVLDADSHASIYDGVRMSGAEVIRFRHSDAADLEKRLRRLGERTANTLIIVEGIYSMLGDQAPLAEIAAVKREYGGMLLVDEAHSLGMLGEHGRGVVEAAGVEDRRRFRGRHLQQESRRHRRLLRQQSPGTGSDPLCHPLLHFHRLAVAVGHRLHARGAAPDAGAPGIARTAVEQRPAPL